MRTRIIVQQHEHERFAFPPLIRDDYHAFQFAHLSLADQYVQSSFSRRPRTAGCRDPASAASLNEIISGALPSEAAVCLRTGLHRLKRFPCNSSSAVEL